MKTWVAVLGRLYEEAEPGSEEEAFYFHWVRSIILELELEQEVAEVKRLVKNCPDCWVVPGEYHSLGCDVERCPGCGGQMLSCDCEFEDSERMKWDGTWPGVKECEELDLWCVWGPPWITCTKDTPGATHDLNRLAIMRWDRKLQKHVK